MIKVNKILSHKIIFFKLVNDLWIKVTKILSTLKVVLKYSGASLVKIKFQEIYQFKWNFHMFKSFSEFENKVKGT